ncbi:exonuclease domain-containing protein [Salmonella enterica]|uniref:3'-5' exonuclease n=1 Tax=Salmonella enterica TaxID=28901 RepID=UPI001EE8EE04|nr:3'-5' exonuclease [Salmonella enterica]
MELNKREAFFAAIFNGFLSHKDQFNDANPDEAIRTCWAMADRIIYHSDRVESPREIANRWINKNIVIVDTETTGLGREAEIIEISIIDCTGAILLNTLIKPSKDIPAEATEIHGITDEMVEDAPSWKEMLPQVLELISHGWVAYNAKFGENVRASVRLSR